MKLFNLLSAACAIAPAVFMLFVVWRANSLRGDPDDNGSDLWALFTVLSSLAFLSTLFTLVLQTLAPPIGDQGPLSGYVPGLTVNLLGGLVAVLVQLLGMVIGGFSSRYLQGEPGQMRYIAGFAGVLAAVHVLLLANHWLVLIAAWALVGKALQGLLCFYPGRPFALLAAYKKQIADQVADVLLIIAAASAYLDVGSGSISDLLRQVGTGDASMALEISAVSLVLAVILRTALLPIHGWLIQVMEAPTPVSALLHAGVVNLGGFILIRFSPLLDVSSVARWLLVIFGLGTALLAGFVILTRISIKVRLAWSTVAQMGFMVLECGLGLYQLAIMHLIGHSLYKAHTFLSASMVVRQTRLRMLHVTAPTRRISLLVAPLLAYAIVSLVQNLVGSTGAIWPWWWSIVLAAAWAPMFWLPMNVDDEAPPTWYRLLAGIGMLVLLMLAALLAHAVPLGIGSSPHHSAGIVALAGMSLMYVGLATLQWHQGCWGTWRRWSYAGFYIDEFYTRLALRLWPTRWLSATHLARQPDCLATEASTGKQ
ncbi:MAG: NADH-quinone oxidoreductase subunit L [Methylophilaceae bacterium]|uniref:NADH-quinone oxidoreductase subunit L n=1 Tax=Methylicorpusculum sp. TaxID=2713644 RepID=UPI002736ACFA|nr:NADH-quinone oxidoreductase subunit L [Methylicorpusculum sp.]MDP3529489.1 NADH-quinone oxidoreductase subunit L [Methylicorpusculum sp.]MDZ4098017.1 NADH-quinone oxidoreductase subunit L [Methylophilaceae bacterium]